MDLRWWLVRVQEFELCVWLIVLVQFGLVWFCLVLLVLCEVMYQKGVFVVFVVIVFVVGIELVREVVSVYFECVCREFVYNVVDMYENN